MLFCARRFDYCSRPVKPAQLGSLPSSSSFRSVKYTQTGPLIYKQNVVKLSYIQYHFGPTEKWHCGDKEDNSSTCLLDSIL